MLFDAVKMVTSLRSLAYGTPETLKELTMLRAFLQGRRQTAPVPAGACIPTLGDGKGS